MRNSRILLALCSLCLFAGIAPNVFAQQQNRSQNFDRIFQGLLDSPMNSQQGLTPVPQAEASAQMRSARQGLQRFSDGIQQLYTALRQEEWYSAAIRPLLADALQIRASVEVLNNKSLSMRDVAQLRPEYEIVDQQWHTFAHRVENWPNLADGVYQQVTGLNRLNDQLETILKVTPQVERTELLNLLSSVSVDYDRLKGDIELDLAQDPNQREYLQKMQRLQSMVYYLRQAVNANHPHEELVGRFKQLHSEWLPLKNGLRLINNRYVQRSMTRIAQANDRIHDLLWIQEVIDGNEILALATSLKQNVDQIADQVSLRKLLESPNAQAVFNRVKEFYTMSGAFRQSVATKTQIEELRWDFRELDVAWNDVRAALSHSTDPQVLQHLATVHFTVTELRDSLGERPAIDNNQTLELIASIDSMSELLHFDINNGIANSNRYDNTFRTNILRSSQTFHRFAHTLQTQVAQNANESAIRQATSQLVNQWRDLRGYISRVTNRPQTMRNAQQIEQALAKLQVHNAL